MDSNWLTLAIDIVNIQTGRRLVRMYLKHVDDLLLEIFMHWFYETPVLRARLRSSSSPENLTISNGSSTSTDEPEPENLPSDFMQIID